MAQYRKQQAKVREELVERLKKQHMGDDVSQATGLQPEGVSEARTATNPSEEQPFDLVAPLTRKQRTSGERRKAEARAYDTGELKHPDFRALPEPERTFRRIDYITHDLQGVTPGQRIVAVALVMALRGHDGRTRIQKNDIMPPSMYSVTLRLNAVKYLEEIGLCHTWGGSWGTDVELLF